MEKFIRKRKSSWIKIKFLRLMVLCWRSLISSNHQKYSCSWGHRPFCFWPFFLRSLKDPNRSNSCLKGRRVAFRLGQSTFCIWWWPEDRQQLKINKKFTDNHRYDDSYNDDDHFVSAFRGYDDCHIRCKTFELCFHDLLIGNLSTRAICNRKRVQGCCFLNCIVNCDSAFDVSWAWL